MLVRVSLSNFVHFRGKTTDENKDNEDQDEEKHVHEFKFSDGGGAFFFIGGNRSGKSCVFEAIRRCMSTSKNFFFSTRHNNREPLVVICEFLDKPKNETIYSCYIFPKPKDREKISDSESTKPVALKIFFIKDSKACVTKQSLVKELVVDLLKTNTDGFPVNRCFKLFNISKNSPEEYLSKKQITVKVIYSFAQKYIFNSVDYKEFLEKNIQKYNGQTECENKLKERVDSQVVITDPMRSISPVQWTKSKKLDIVERTRENINFVKEMRERSEILAWFLEETSEEERCEVNKIFNILTTNSRVTFERRDGDIVVVDNGNVVSLEKAPEGILEAMICSILVSNDGFKTVCLEEPGRGMHMQMIERLRDFILKGITDKTVIIISHNPTFLSSWNLDNIFFFRGSTTAGDVSFFTATKGDSILTDKECKSKRIMTSSTMGTIFFARRVLLVEGESDLRFVVELKSILFENAVIVKDMYDLLKKELEEKIEAEDLFLDGFRKFISSLHILNLQGEQNKYRVAKVCRALQIERYFLLDYDAIFEQSNEAFLKDFILCDKNSKLETSQADASLFGEKGIFVWRNDLLPKSENVKGGTIEYVLYFLCEQYPELKKIFEENKVKLKKIEKAVKSYPESKNEQAGKVSQDSNSSQESKVSQESKASQESIISQESKDSYYGIFV